VGPGHPVKVNMPANHQPMLAATGFEIVTADVSGSVYGAYTCCKR
jgi:hypothetical protein